MKIGLFGAGSLGRDNPIIGIFSSAGMDTKAFRNRRSGDIRIQNSGVIAAAAHLYSHHGSNQAFSYAAFAADDPDNFLYVADRIEFFNKILRCLTRCTVLTAGAAVMGAIFRCFTHFFHPHQNKK